MRETKPLWLEGQILVPEPTHTPTPEERAVMAEQLRRPPVSFSTSMTEMILLGYERPPAPEITTDADGREWYRVSGEVWRPLPAQDAS